MATERTHPRQLTEADVLAWCGAATANNTIRNRLSRVCTFLRWCVRTGEADPALVEVLASRDHPLSRIPRLYGKVQGKYPARWLTHAEAFGALVGGCDNTDIGRRDALVLRLGLAGMRLSEILHLQIGSLRLNESPPRIAWIGKARRSRTIVPGAQLVELLADYLARYATAIGRPLTPTDPVVSRGKPGGGVALGRVSWGNPLKQPCSIQRIVALRADAAGLGHLTPHDLRRSAAGILHRSTDDNGKHDFDLLDIQRVLGHSDPATTMRSYLEPIDTQTITRASTFLD